MEKKKWIFIVLFALMVVMLPLASGILEPNQVQNLYIGDLTNMILDKLGAGRVSSKPSNNEVIIEEVIIEKAEAEPDAPVPSSRKYLAPNLTACHPNYGRDDLLVYCCPPGFSTPEPYVDFKFPDANAPKRVRRKVKNVDKNYIEKYHKALSYIKGLPFGDPRSFQRQANMHCLFCTGAYEQQNSRTELNIHRTWLFFPWHRMMIWFHEKIIGDLMGDPTFALPMWTWDIPEGMVIPDMYVDPNLAFFHTERDLTHFPPRTADLNYVLPERFLPPAEQIDINLAFMYNQMVSGARKTELFMGCTYKANEGYCNGPGTVEAAPHNTLHTWVGSPLNLGREDMGKFYSAARDPIFYAHHANIDRLWEAWREINNHTLDITDSDWLNSFFFFYDEKLQLTRIKVRDVLDISKLGYEYEEVERPWLNYRPSPSVPPKEARQILKTREKENKLSSNHVSTSDFRPHGRVLDTSLTVKLYRAENHLIKKQNKEEETIVVYGIDVKGDDYVKFDVYVNLVDETKISPKFREFAGTFAQIPGGGNMMKNITMKLGVSELLQDLEADQDESIWVTLLPVTPTCRNIKIEGVKIEYLK